MPREELPWGWLRVTGAVRESQLDLFEKTRDELLAIARISLDELERWRAKGWISFDASNLNTMAERLFNEVIFIRNLARSGLSDVQIATLLADLEPPYRYHPTRTAYSFAYGWVQPPPILDEDEVNAFVRAHLPKWIDDKARLGEIDILKELQSKLFSAIAKALAESNKESENE